MQYAGYGKFITEYINQANPGVPIYTTDMVKEVVERFNTDEPQARRVVNVTLKRLADGNDVADLQRFEKGIYYKPKKTAFGVSLLNPLQIAIDNYAKKADEEFGYETGPSFLNRLGLTTQIPKYRYFATNKCDRYGDNLNEKLKIVLRRPVISVTSGNRGYLQLLDVLQNKDKTPIDVVDAQKRLTIFIEQNNLDFRKLIAFAYKCYSREVTLRVAELAAEIEV
jgi:hypothetical protein